MQQSSVSSKPEPKQLSVPHLMKCVSRAMQMMTSSEENTHRKFPRQSESWSQSPSPARWPKSSLDLTHRHNQNQVTPSPPGQPCLQNTACPRCNRSRRLGIAPPKVAVGCSSNRLLSRNPSCVCIIIVFCGNQSILVSKNAEISQILPSAIVLATLQIIFTIRVAITVSFACEIPFAMTIYFQHKIKPTFFAGIVLATAAIFSITRIPARKKTMSNSIFQRWIKPAAVISVVKSRSPRTTVILTTHLNKNLGTTKSFPCTFPEGHDLLLRPQVFSLLFFHIKFNLTKPRSQSLSLSQSPSPGMKCIK